MRQAADIGGMPTHSGSRRDHPAIGCLCESPGPKVLCTKCWTPCETICYRWCNPSWRAEITWDRFSVPGSSASSGWTPPTTQDVRLIETRILLDPLGRQCLHNGRRLWIMLKKRGCETKYQRHLPIFPPTSPLESIAIDILGRLPRTKNRSEFVVIITDRCSKLTRAIASTKTSTSCVATILFDNQIVPNGIPSFLLNPNGPQFVDNLIWKSCPELKVRHLTRTEYHP